MSIIEAGIEAIQKEIDIYEEATTYEPPDDHQHGWFCGMYKAQTILRTLNTEPCPDATLHQNRKQMSGHIFCVSCGARL